MRIRSLLLAGAVLPFAMPYASFAQNPAPAGWVLAQNECPEGENCEQGKGKARQRAKQQQQEQPAQEQPRPRRQQQQQQEQPAQQQEQPRPRRQQQQQQEQPAQQQEQPRPRRQQQQQQEQPAQQQEQPRPRRQQAPAQEQPAEQPQAEQPAEQPRRERRPEAPAQEQPQAEQPAAETPQQRPRDRRQQPGEQAAPDQPAAEPQDEAGQGSDRDQAIDRARRRQQQLQQQGQEQPAEPAQERPRGERPRAGAETPPAEGDSTVERQLEAQGDQAEADRVRGLRDKARRERAAARQAESPGENAGAADQGEQRRDRDGRDVDIDIDRDVDIDIDRDVFIDRDIVERRGGRVIIRDGDRTFVRPIVPDEGDRLLYRARDVDVDRLPGGRTRTVVHRDNGATVITIRDDYGNLVRRVRRGPDGRDIIIINNRYPEFGRPPPPFIYRPGALPRLVIRIPPERYVVDYGYASPDIIYETLLAPPVMPIERPYTLDEVLLNEEVRAYQPRIDLDTITFEFGSSTIGPDQMQALSALGDAMQQVLTENPAEVYLIEGHTDAVGSDNDNLILSDERAESVAVALSQNFDVPAENLVTEGYGEQYLKVPTEDAERQNRRVTVRRITPLLSQQDDQQAGEAPNGAQAGEAP